MRRLLVEDEEGELEGGEDEGEEDEGEEDEGEEDEGAEAGGADLDFSSPGGLDNASATTLSRPGTCLIRLVNSAT